MLPFIRKRLVEPIWTLKSGSPKVQYWRQLEKNQYFSEKTLLKKQWASLQDIITYAYHNNTFYRYKFDSAGILPELIKNKDDILKLPIITKDDIRLNYETIITNGYDKKILYHSRTGGSTGTSLELFKTEQCTELKNACSRRHDRWTGWEVGEPIAAVWGNPEIPGSFKEKMRNVLLTPLIYLDTMNINEKAVINFMNEWAKVKPTLLFGHSHSLFILAKYLVKLRIALQGPPKGIISTSMMLLPTERDYIEKVFGVKVFNRYGTEEVSLIASECEKHEGLHLNIEHLFVEFIKPDGTHAEPGEKGTIVVTDLLNKAMPFIRYRVDDVGIPSDRKCFCGRGLPLMEKVIGRVADFLVRKDGGLVAGVSLIEKTLTAIPGIQQMQIIQETIDDISVNVVKDPAFDSRSVRRMSSEIKKALGESVTVTLHFVERIKQEESGKYRFSISRVKPDICGIKANP